MSSIDVPAGTVVRTWTGWVRPEDADTYAQYIEETGMAEYRSTAGNLGAFMVLTGEGERVKVTTVSFWTDLDVIRGFAGDDISRAVFYDQDDRYLVDRETRVTHGTVV
jgi:hypothetical protein